MSLDKQYSPGVHKLIYNLDHLYKVVHSHLVGPIHVSVWPTTKCQCHCEFCSFHNTNLAGDTRELDSDELLYALGVLQTYGLKAVEFSGGGDPLLWLRDRPMLLTKLKNRGLSLSLITNGYALKDMPVDSLKQFNWIRVSLHSVEHAERILFECPIPFSASFMVSENTKIHDLRSIMNYCADKIILRIGIRQPSSREFTEYVRSIVTPPAFFTYKPYGAPSGCYMPWIRAGIDWRGNFIPCPGRQLTPESAGRVDDSFALCNIENIGQWLAANAPRDIGYKCSLCSCGKEINDYIHCIRNGNLPKDSEFV